MESSELWRKEREAQDELQLVTQSWEQAMNSFQSVVPVSYFHSFPKTVEMLTICLFIGSSNGVGIHGIDASKDA